MKYLALTWRWSLSSKYLQFQQSSMNQELRFLRTQKPNMLIALSADPKSDNVVGMGVVTVSCSDTA